MEDSIDCRLYLFRKENSIFRLRKWIIARLSSIIDNHQVKKQEDLIMDVARSDLHLVERYKLLSV